MFLYNLFRVYFSFEFRLRILIFINSKIKIIIWLILVLMLGKRLVVKLVVKWGVERKL